MRRAAPMSVLFLSKTQEQQHPLPPLGYFPAFLTAVQNLPEDFLSHLNYRQLLLRWKAFPKSGNTLAIDPEIPQPYLPVLLFSLHILSFANFLRSV